MIPKKIHYFWFGGKEMPAKDKKCIESWRKYCPDYEIIEWNERNYDIKKSPYMYAAYKEKKWGFASDYARFDVIYSEGGIYMDTDVELIRNLDEFLKNHSFMGFEGGKFTSPGLGFGAEKGFHLMKEIRDIYDNLSFYKEDGSLNLVPSPFYVTEYLCNKGLKRNDSLQVIEGMTIFPTEFFCPKDYKTGKIKITGNTHSIHHYNASWTSPMYRFKLQFTRLIGVSNFNRLLKIKKMFFK